MANNIIDTLLVGNTNYDISANTPIGECSVAAGTAAKTVSLGADNYTLRAGAVVTVKFTNTNTAANPTLNVAGTGAKSIMYGSVAITTENLDKAGTAGLYMRYMYDGTYWVWVGSSIDAAGSAGHTILNGSGTAMAAEPNLQFIGASVTDDPTNNKTVVKMDTTVYRAAGDKTVAELTSALLVAANQGCVYNMTTSGTTTSDFVEGQGKPIAVGDNVGVVDVGTAGSPVYKFDLLSGFVDLTPYQTKALATPITVDGTQQSNVEGALDAINTYCGQKADQTGVAIQMTQAQYDALSTAEKNDGRLRVITDRSAGPMAAAGQLAIDTEGIVTTPGGNTNTQALLDELAEESVALNNSLTQKTLYYDLTMSAGTNTTIASVTDSKITEDYRPAYFNRSKPTATFLSSWSIDGTTHTFSITGTCTDATNNTIQVELVRKDN